MEIRQAIHRAVAGMVIGRVVAQHNELRALQRHYPIGFWPAPVVAQAHAHHAAKGIPYGKTQVARFEVTLLQMLGVAAGLRLHMPGQMDLAVLADDFPVRADKNGRVVVMRLAVFDGQLRVADVEADSQGARLVEQGLRLRIRHFRLVPAVQLGPSFNQPPRKKCGQRQLGINH
ncbi:hypothetical protein D3C87_1303730 [compost metagenome]